MCGQWISVEDELPSGNQIVIGAWHNPKSGERATDTAWIDENGIWRNDEGVLSDFGYGITHWQPLPAPPTKEDEAEVCCDFDFFDKLENLESELE